jgi:outer membrane receptor protein involved in Fe transport
VYGSDAISGVVNIITRKDFAGSEVYAFGGTSNYGDGTLVDVGATTGQVTDKGNILFSGGFIKQQPAWSGDRAFSKYDATYDFYSGEVFTLGSSSIPQGRLFRAGITGTGNAAWQALLTQFPTASSFTLDATSNQWRPYNGVGVTDAGGDQYNYQPENYLVTPQQRGHLFAVGEYKFSPDVRGYFEASFTNRVSEQKLAAEPLFVGAGVEAAGGDLYNFQPDNYLVTPQQRGHLFAVGEYKFSNDVRGYFEASFTNRVSEQKLAPEPLIIGPGIGGEDVYISAQNPYNPFGVDFFRYRRRLTEFGNRIYRQDVNTFRVVTGVQGSLPILSNWNWDVSLNLGRNDATSFKTGLVQLSLLQNALGPGYFDPVTGQAVCGTPGNEIEGCVPINLFGGAAAQSIKPEMMKYLSYNGTALGYNQQFMVAANLAGELFRITPSAHLSGFALGYEFRKEAGAYYNDPLTAKGDTSGNKGEDTAGSFSVNEGYVELSLPILGQFGEQTQGGKDLLELSAAARYVNYSTFGDNVSYKAGIRLSPIQDITLRGTYSTAFRAPSIGELYSGQQDSFPAVTDPCSAATQGADRPQGTAVDLACDADGVPNNHFDDSKQLRSRVGGNPNLKPETANIFTAGLVVEPRFLKDFSLTVDYYNVAVNQAIDTIGEDIILSSCYPAAAGVEAQYCDYINRDPGSHTITSIFNPLNNVGGSFTSGVDVGARFEPETPMGRFLFDADVAWLGSFDNLFSGTASTKYGTGTLYEGKGNYDLGVHPEWVGNAGITWAMDPIRVGVRGRMIGPYKECADSDGYAAGGGGICHQDDPSDPPPYSRIVQPYFIMDANASWTLNSGLGASTISAGVNNLLNTEPARVYNGFTSNSETSAYDYMMRYFYARITHKF